MFINQVDSRMPGRGQGGFTLMETMVASAIGSLLLLAMASFFLFSGRSFAALANYSDLEYASRNALDKITSEIRQVNSVSSYTTNQITFSTTNGTVTFTYSPLGRTLTRTHSSGSSEVLLKECDHLSFGIYQRNTIGGTYNQYPSATNNPFQTKVVQLNWTCSREILGSRINTESVQTAKIVIRKQ